MKIGFIDQYSGESLVRADKIRSYLKANGLYYKELVPRNNNLYSANRCSSNIYNSFIGTIRLAIKKLLHGERYSLGMARKAFCYINRLKEDIAWQRDYIIGTLKDINVLHAETHLPAYICSQVKKKTGMPYVFDMRGLLVDEEINKSISLGAKLSKADWIQFCRMVERAAVKDADKVIVVSVAMRDYLMRNYQKKKEDIVVIPNAASLYSVSAQYDTDMKLIYGGSFEYWEGVHDYIRIAKYLDGNNFKMYLFGEGSLHENILDIIRNESLNIIDLGRKKRQDALNLFSKMQIGVAPSSNDIVRKVSSPVKIFDYASCGLPIITVEVGEWSNIVKEYDCGIVVKNSDPEEFAKAIWQLRDENLWRKKSENGRRMIREKYNWSNVLRPLLEIYKNNL